MAPERAIRICETMRCVWRKHASHRWIETGPLEERQACLELHCFGVWPEVRHHSCTSTTALAGLGVEVTALLANPIGFQILRAVEMLRPGVARDEVLGAMLLTRCA